MKKKYAYLLINVILIIFLIITINNKVLLKGAITSSFIMWFNYLLPSIFPVTIIIKLLINNQFYQLINHKIYHYFNKYFNFNGIALALILISIVVGSPTAQIIYNDALKKQLIDYHSFKKLVIASSVINPIFFFNINSHLTLRCKITFILTSIVTTFGLFFIIKIPDNNIRNTQINKDSLINIITSTFMIMINILSIIIFFNIIIAITNLIPNCIIKHLIVSMFEITSGINYLKGITNPILRKTLTIFLSSFLGLAINMQIKSIIKDKGLYNTYMKVLLLKSLFITCIVSMFT